MNDSLVEYIRQLSSWINQAMEKEKRIIKTKFCSRISATQINETNLGRTKYEHNFSNNLCDYPIPLKSARKTRKT